MIRVLQVVGKMHYGGMETLIMNIYRNIDRSKVQFDFLVHYPEPGEYDEEIKSLGGKIYVMPRTTFGNFFKYKKALTEFFKSHPEYKVIHGHLQSTAFLYHSIAKKYGKRYCITHAHNNGVEHTIKGRVSYLTSLLAIKHTDGFFGCSKEACEYFFKKAIKKGKEMQVLPNGIEVDKYLFQSKIRENIRKELGIENKLVMGHVGRFFEQKNHVFLIDVFEQVAKKREDAVLLLIGKGPDEDKIRQKVKEKGLDKKVMFLGAKDNVNQLMMGMDVFLLPSLFEGFGIVLIEAQATGLPCVCTKNTIPLTTKITDGYYPVSLQEKPEVWADEILKAYDASKDNDREAFNQCAKEAGYDIKEIAGQIEKQYIGYSSPYFR